MAYTDVQNPATGGVASNVLGGLTGGYKATSPGRSIVSNPYVSAGVNLVAKSAPRAVSWGTFQWIVGGLLLALVCLVGLIYHNLESSIADLGQAQRETTQQVTETKVELVKAIGGVREEAAATNAKLQLVIEALQRPR